MEQDLNREPEPKSETPHSVARFVDSHAHIDGEEYDSDRDEAIARARAAGVQAILTVGTGDPNRGGLERAVRLAEKHGDIFAAVGIHPHDAALFDDQVAAQILKLIRGSSRVLAWGEIGLDYHYDHSPRAVQREVFRRQLRLAHQSGLPVIIHTREAEEDTIEILREEWKGSLRRGIMHCFSGSTTLADAALDLGFLISFAGVITFKNAGSLRDLAATLPLDRLLIETDCPYLSPVPFRGKRNEPAHVVEVARSLAEIHGVSLAEMAQITTNNFVELFPQGAL